MTGYCSVADVLNILQALQGIIQVGSEAEDNLTEAQVKEYIDDVERRIDARIAFKYATPLEIPTDDVINQIVKYRTAYDIYMVVFPSRNLEILPEAVKEWKVLADGMQQEVVSGAILLTVPPLSGAGYKITTSHLKRAREIEIRLIDYDWYFLGYEFIVENSFIVRTSLTDRTSKLVYGTDYEMVWKEGKMRRVRGTSISSGQVVYCYFLYLATMDYRGELREQTKLQEEGYI